MYRKRKSVHSLRVEYTSSTVYGLVLTLEQRNEYLPFYLQQVNITPVLKALYMYDLIWTLLDTGFLVKQKWLGSDYL